MDLRRKLSSGGESFSEGTSRFFNSVMAKKNGLMNDLSNKIESVGATLMKSSPSGSSLEDSAEEGVATKYEYEINQNNPKTRKNRENSEEKISRPSRPEHDRTDHSRPEHGRPEHSRPEHGRPEPSRPEHGRPEPSRTEHSRTESHYRWRQDSRSSSGSEGGDESFPATGVNMSFDEPLYSPNKVTTPERSTGVTNNATWRGSRSSTPPVIPPPPFNPNKTGRRSSRSSTNSPMLSGHSSDSERYMDGDKNLNDEKVRAPSFAQTKRRSSTVDEMLFDDYVEPVVTVEEKKVAPAEEDSVFQKRKTLLPMGDLISFDEPELEDFHPRPIGDRKKIRNVVEGKDTVKSRDKSFPSVSSVASSDGEFSENQLNNQTSVDSSEPEYERDHTRRLDSLGSNQSWSSNYSLDSQPDDLTMECMSFMKTFVDMIFNTRGDISQIDKAKFGEYCQQVPGRQWFARYVNSQRVVSKKVEESIFFRLVQYFAVVLFECNESEDFVPAKNLMNMCFTFYYESRCGKQRYKNFLFSYLREQPIWQSLRFWHAAFFDAVQNERARKPTCTSEDGQDTQTDDSMFQENITFGQLGTFTSNMRAFGLSRELCLEFLRKQAIIADLKKEQIKMLKDNIEKLKEH